MSSLATYYVLPPRAKVIGRSVAPEVWTPELFFCYLPTASSRRSFSNPLKRRRKNTGPETSLSQIDRASQATYHPIPSRLPAFSYLREEPNNLQLK